MCWPSRFIVSVAIVFLVFAAVVLLTAPAVAAPVTVPAGGLVAAGPELDGDRVVWGEEQRDELVLRVGSAGGVVADRLRLPALGAPRTRGFGQLGSVLAATPDWLGFVELTETVTHAEGDSVSGTAESVVRAGPPETGELPFVPVRSGAEASAVAADGPVLAVADRRVGAGARVVVRAPEGTRTFVVSGGRTFVRRLHVAGRYVSWSVERGGGDAMRIVVADRRTGRIVLRLRPSARRKQRLEDHDLRADGAVAVLASERHRGGFRTDLAVASPARPALRLVRRDVSDTRVEIAGDRAAVALLDERTKERALAIVTLSGHRRGRASVVAKFPPGRTLLLRRFGFDGHRIAWAEADIDYHGEATDETPARIKVRDASRR